MADKRLKEKQQFEKSATRDQKVREHAREKELMNELKIEQNRLR